MIFPIYRRAGSVVFLDDDPAYLDMLAEIMSEYWPVKTFMQPSECINALQQEPPRWEADAWRQRAILDEWRAGKALIPQILRYWREDGTARFALHRVCVVDYSMPAMNGIQVLEELLNWLGGRVLLTGRADEQIAVNAFNRGLIHQFVPKQSSDIARRLTAVIQRLLDTPPEPHSQAWRATLSRDQLTLLSATEVGRKLAALAEEHRWVEHLVLGDPFGVLALDAAGQVSWLQLEPRDRLGELAELARLHGVDDAGLKRVQDGACLFDAELVLALGRPVGPAALHPAFCLADQPMVYAALVRLPPELCPGTGRGYDAFLSGTAGPAR